MLSLIGEETRCKVLTHIPHAATLFQNDLIHKRPVNLGLCCKKLCFGWKENECKDITMAQD